MLFVLFHPAGRDHCEKPPDPISLIPDFFITELIDLGENHKEKTQIEIFCFVRFKARLYFQPL